MLPCRPLVANAYETCRLSRILDPKIAKSAFWSGKVEISQKKLVVKARNSKNKKIIGYYDIVVNVSGPLNAETILNEIPLVKSLKLK